MNGPWLFCIWTGVILVLAGIGLFIATAALDWDDDLFRIALVACLVGAPLILFTWLGWNRHQANMSVKHKLQTFYHTDNLPHVYEGTNLDGHHGTMAQIILGNNACTGLVRQENKSAVIVQPIKCVPAPVAPVGVLPEDIINAPVTTTSTSTTSTTLAAK